MKKTRLALRPTVHTLEDRTVMSFSFSNLLHSVFPFIHSSDTTKTTAHMTASQRADLIQKRWDAKTAAATQTTASATTSAIVKINPKTHISNAHIHSKPLQLFLDRHRVTPTSTSTN